MIKLLISLLFFFIISCKSLNDSKLTNLVENKKKEIVSKISKESSDQIKEDKDLNENKVFYYIGDSYFIEGVEYFPEENYSYNQRGIATFYGKELHNIRTANNDINKVTELLGRHKTLPLPSIVQVTNLENGLSLTVKIIDRHDDNASIIQLSRKSAQLLRFYKNKIARVRVEILADPSKQWKNVMQSMNDPSFNETIESAPTDIVSISNINEQTENDFKIPETPIEIGNEDVVDNNLYVKIYEFKNYQEIQSVLKELNITVKNTIEKESTNYNIILGPISNQDVNNLVSSFIMKGYKKTEIIID